MLFLHWNLPSMNDDNSSNSGVLKSWDNDNFVDVSLHDVSEVSLNLLEDFSQQLLPWKFLSSTNVEHIISFFDRNPSIFRIKFKTHHGFFATVDEVSKFLKIDDKVHESWWDDLGLVCLKDAFIDHMTINGVLTMCRNLGVTMINNGNFIFDGRRYTYNGLKKLQIDMLSERVTESEKSIQRLTLANEALVKKVETLSAWYEAKMHWKENVRKHDDNSNESKC